MMDKAIDIIKEVALKADRVILFHSASGKDNSPFGPNITLFQRGRLRLYVCYKRLVSYQSLYKLCLQ